MGMVWVKRIAAALAGLLVLGLVGGWVLINDRPSLAPYEGMMAAAPAQGEVSVRFLGVSTLLIEDGETALLTDGFFSRPGPVQLLTGRIGPDPDAIRVGLERAGITRLAAVIVNHSHYDHAMDAPEVAQRTGALLIGSESTANIGRGWGLAEERIRLARTGEPMPFGRFVVTILPSRHSPTGFTGGEITAPLKPPVPYKDYAEGESYAVLVQHEGKSMLINASAGFEPGALRGVKADVVMLGTGSLGAREEAFRDAYWNEVVAATGARRIIPIHWDDFIFVGAGGPRLPPPRVQGDFDVTMRFLMARAKRDGVDMRMPRDYEAMDVWEGLAAP
jgi:L-ascorbate metabolism protein UlaG (beta-lactamase superfamily)